MQLSQLTTTLLISNFDSLVRTERKITAQILEFIAELDRRRLYLENGHNSLFDYLVKGFGYSPGSAMRRIDAARLLRELPEAASKFQNGSLTLSQASQVQRASRELKKTKKRVLDTDDKRDLILQIESTTQKQTEQILASKLELPLMSVQKETFHRNQSVTVTMTFTAEQMQILVRAQNLISHCVGDNNWADLFTHLAQREIARRTSVRKSAPLGAGEAMTLSERSASAPKSKSRLARSETPSSKSESESVLVAKLESISTSTPPSQLASASKTSPVNYRPAIPADLRKQLLHENAKCAFKYINGTTCGSTKFLQIDHIKSWSDGGSHDPENLQVLCGVHNRLKFSRHKRWGVASKPQSGTLLLE